MSVQKLIDQTFSYSRTNTDLKDLYMSDMKDFIAIDSLLGAKHFESASKLVDEMDTEPREQICMAIAAEYGQEFLAKNFGYEVA